MATQTQNKAPAKAKLEKKTSGKKVKTNFGRYIAKIQKKADSKIHISVKAIQTIDGMVTELVNSISEIIGELHRKNKKNTLSVEDVKAALKLKCDDGELSKHCIMEGSKAVMKFQKK